MAYTRAHGEAFSELIELFLGLLFKSADNFVLEKTQKKNIYKEYGEINLDKFTKKQIANHFYELKRAGYVDEIERDGEKALRLTNKGKIRIVEIIVEKQPPDGKYRFVSFDIPERLHRQRDLFRRAIKRMGFRQVQQSLWVSDKNIGEMVETVADEYHVSDYIAYIISEKSNIDLLLERTLKE